MIPITVKEWLNPYLPKKIAVYNGVAVRDTGFLYMADHYPNVKRELTNATLHASKQGDRVVFVGAGKGVAPVKVARRDRQSVVHEAARSFVKQLRETAKMNDVDIEIHHSLVETGYDVWDSEAGATHLETDDLSGDVLVLDCEGAEQDILPAPQFDSVVVETHPQFGAVTEEIRTQMYEKPSEYAETNHEGVILVR